MDVIKSIRISSSLPYSCQSFPNQGRSIDPYREYMPSNWRWWDTVAVNKTAIAIRHRFSDYDGKFVLHCHILIREYQGMMRNVRIVGKE